MDTICTDVSVFLAAALVLIAPGEVPRAAGRLRQFLRASFDQHERVLVPLEDELALVSAYLEIESLRIGKRLEVEWAIDPCLLKVLIPPLSLEVWSEVEEGTAVTLRIPLGFENANTWLEAVAGLRRRLAS